VLTVDFFPPIVDDPFTYGAIAAANALSDVYAMGGRPVTALNVAAIPADLPPEILAQMLSGGAAKAAEAGVSVIGGHTVTDDEPKYGMSVIGYIHPDKIITNANAQPGDKLVLTKPIGTGIISTAGKAQEADPEVLSNAAKIMGVLNKGASEAMIEVGVHSATDITGYGLVGHAAEMARGSGVGIQLSPVAVPLIPGTLELLERGIVPGGTHRNLAGVLGSADWDDALTANQKLLMCDAQTSGGLLISVAADKCDNLIVALNAADTPAAAVIGSVTDEPSGIVRVSL
jgi:selenide,water dikinase